MTGRAAQLAAAVRKMADAGSSIRVRGIVSAAGTGRIEVKGLSHAANLGDLVSIATQTREELAEVVHITPDATVAVTFQKQSNVRLGNLATLLGRPVLQPHASWLGRAIDPLGNPLDDGGPLITGPRAMPLDRDPPRAMDRNRVTARLRTGVRAIDIFMPICAGQRLGIFAGSGVGKSTLLAMLSGMPSAQTVVLALVGERGREVREFLEDVLGGRRERVVAVVATGDDNPAIRRIAPKAAMTIAEYFRDCGESVLLMIDSITRFAQSQRECALAANEPPVARGYPPSVFTEIARLLERGGPGPRGKGDITTLATVLVDGDDHNDPVADAARGILDGHIVLDRKIAGQARWPAIDLVGSLSRLAEKAWSPEDRGIVETARAMIARYEDTRDLRLIGGYQPGTDPDLDRAVALVPKIYDLVKQSPDERSEGAGDAIERLQMLLTR